MWQSSTTDLQFQFETLRQHHILNNLVHFLTSTFYFAQLVYYRIQWEKFEGCPNFKAQLFDKLAKPSDTVNKYYGITNHGE